MVGLEKGGLARRVGKRGASSGWVKGWGRAFPFGLLETRFCSTWTNLAPTWATSAAVAAAGVAGAVWQAQYCWCGMARHASSEGNKAGFD